MSLIKSIISVISEVEKLPKDFYQLSVIGDDINYVNIDLETQMVGTQFIVTEPCGCCQNYEYEDVSFENIRIEDKIAIIYELYELKCKK